MRESITSPSDSPPAVGRLSEGQIAQRSTWAQVTDRDTALAAMHVIRVIPAGSTTITQVNPLDPASAADAVAPETGWLEPPGAYGPLYSTRPAWWMR